MKVYYLNTEYELGKHKIVEVWAEGLGINTPEAGIHEPYSMLEFDELYNRKLASWLIQSNRELEDLPDLFYVDNAGSLREVGDDSLITINPNPQKEAYKLSQLYGLTQAQLETYIDNNVTNLAEAKAFLKKLAAVTLWLVKQTKLDE